MFFFFFISPHLLFFRISEYVYWFQVLHLQEDYSPTSTFHVSGYYVKKVIKYKMMTVVWLIGSGDRTTAFLYVRYV